MALTTLPYPSLDFVPLDILTAEEMNQIVANYTAINNSTIGTNQLANNSITTKKLANKAVTSDKVDWTTFKFPIPDYSNGTSISNSTNTWTAPKCGVVVATLVTDTTNGYKNVTISVNDKVVAKSLWTGPTGGYNLQVPAIVPVATGDKVTFSAKDGGSTVDGRVFYPYKWV